ncbi:MAG: hypothetical protein EP335_14105 [Alphaproteobacteria bacterium]|nr:MAG: hypothetical protein EP335_14105 [Alphaproteobacteria bacterium]
MSENLNQQDQHGTREKFVEQPVRTEEDMARIRRRNKALGLALGAFVVLLAIFSYFRVKGLTP